MFASPEIYAAVFPDEAETSQNPQPTVHEVAPTDKAEFDEMKDMIRSMGYDLPVS